MRLHVQSINQDASIVWKPCSPIFPAIARWYSNCVLRTVPSRSLPLAAAGTFQSRVGRGRQPDLRRSRHGNGGRSMSAAKNGKDKDKNKSGTSDDRQKEIERLEKDVEDLRQLAGDDKAADAEFERGQQTGRRITPRVLRAPRPLAARPDCQAPESALYVWTSSACCSPISSSCTATAILATIKLWSPASPNFMAAPSR